MSELLFKVGFDKLPRSFFTFGCLVTKRSLTCLQKEGKHHNFLKKTIGSVLGGLGKTKCQIVNLQRFEFFRFQWSLGKGFGGIF